MKPGFHCALAWWNPGFMWVRRERRAPGSRDSSAEPLACLDLPRVVYHRCVAPTMPFGALRHPMRAGADLSLPGIARLVAEFLGRLDLHEVTLMGIRVADAAETRPPPGG